MSAFALTSPEVLDEDRLREHEADFTPTPVVRQLLDAAPYFARWGSSEPTRVCDPAAGAGVWSMVMREMWPETEITAIDIRGEEVEHLERHADTVHIGDAIVWANEYRAPSFDVAATNPSFSLFAEYADAYLRICTDVWLFAPVDAMVRGEDSYRWLSANAKWVECALWVAGGVGFRGPGRNQDFRQYGLWMLTSNETGCSTGWPVRLMPWLPGHDRKWVIRPGTERA